MNNKQKKQEPQTRVEQATYIVERVKSLGIPINPSSRLMQMLHILESGYIDYEDPRFPIPLESIRDMYQLRLVVDEMDCHRNNPKFCASVKKLLQDAAAPQDGNSNSPGRDMQFELYLAAIALHDGMMCWFPTTNCDESAESALAAFQRPFLEGMPNLNDLTKVDPADDGHRQDETE